jgi:hypothetical protein
LLSLEGVGFVFVVIFLAAYLGGLPTTNVLQDQPAFRIPLQAFGFVLLVLILATVVLAAYSTSGKKQAQTPASNATAKERSYTPMKIGLFIVTLAYFLFAVHSTFTLSWIGEWNRAGVFSFYVYITDLSAFAGLPFRLAASLIAVGAVTFYFNKGFPATSRAYKILRWILVLEGIYWLSLLTTGIMNVYDLITTFNHLSTIVYQTRTAYITALNGALTSLALNTIPSVVESVLMPAVLFVFALKLNPNTPANKTIKWALITGTSYIFVLWLTNTSMWLITIIYQTGTAYITSHPENLLSFIITTCGLLALAIYSAYFTYKSRNLQTWQNLKLKTAGAILTAFGLFFLWNYLTWIFFGGWSDWFAWFLGHNLDLWMLSLAMLGLPLLFADKLERKPRHDNI